MRKNILISFIFLVGLIGVALFSANSPSKEQDRGPKALTHFFAESLKEPLSDPYTSSLYRPGEILFEPLLDYQNGRLDRAIPKLKSLSDKGNADAMYWYANHLMRVSVKSRLDGYKWFEKSAKQGNPYSAMMLDSANETCRTYFGSLCEASWGEVSKQLLRERAEQGDIRAKYYLEKPKDPFISKNFSKWISLIEEAAKENFFAPVMELIFVYENQSKLNKEQRNDLRHVLTFMANRNFVPAYDRLYVYSDSQTTYDEAIKLGSKAQLTDRALECGEISDTISDSDLIDCLSEGYTLEEVYNDSLPLRFIHTPNKPEIIEKAKLKSTEFIKSMTPMIYIDEMHENGFY
ncbi:sel1 repeat family protein [Grimontia sp. S25]|uniref:Sel1 repeat family protein n=1 Tax=Grimontia sedimenti TaxID=2711294 RepID=A0A6M1RR35_9GAMM|nr:sel1 repeat family protein [Grimontia sedimenti]NGO00409.1 sel1 repeat family protein [Grimontia sedimenti]